jgi:DNA polymerase-1
VAAAAARMTRRGFLVDEAQVRRTRTWCQEELALTLPRLRAAKIYSLGATGRGREQAVAALLADGAPLTKRTPSGAWSLDREVLDGLADAGFELAGLVRRARRADRYQRDYLTKMLTNQGTDGRVRPEIRTLGARTGRWAVGGALPVQQIPTRRGFGSASSPTPTAFSWPTTTPASSTSPWRRSPGTPACSPSSGQGSTHTSKPRR